MTENPYAPPHSSLVLPPREVADSDLASQGQRFATFLVDRLAIVGLAFALGLVLAVLGSPLSGETSALFDWALGLAISFAYYWLAEATTGRTVGKLVAGTRVVASSGHPPTATEIFLRTLSRFVPFDAFSFLGSGPCVGWHDRWSKTRVIRTR